MTILSFFLGLILVLNIALAFTVIFLERKDASTTWAWLMVLLFIPILGFILYLIFGRRISGQRIFTWDTKAKLGVKFAVQEQLRALENDAFQFENDTQLAAYDDLYYLHLRSDDAILTQNNDVQIFTDGAKKFQQLLQDMEEATDHIHLQYYILRNDWLGERTAEILVRKARQGVEVRVLYDDMGSRKINRNYLRRLKQEGIMIESFFPPKIPKVNLKINYRNHRKLAIIDGSIGYIGGFNIGDEYLGYNRKFGYWRDTHLRIIGNAVENMQTRFILDWNQASRHHIGYNERYFAAESGGDVGMQIVSSGPDSDLEQIKNGYIRMIMSAKKYVYIQTPYFIPDDSLQDALRIATLSGVDVKLMIPNKPDHPFVYWATFSYIGDLLNAGAEIYIYQNGFLHAKTLIVDGKIASVGTANIDVRSFRLNFEVNAFLYNEELSQELLHAFYRDMTRSTQMTRTLYQNRSLGIRFKESISRLLSPVL